MAVRRFHPLSHGVISTDTFAEMLTLEGLAHGQRLFVADWDSDTRGFFFSYIGPPYSETGIFVYDDGTQYDRSGNVIE